MKRPQLLALFIIMVGIIYYLYTKDQNKPSDELQNKCLVWTTYSPEKQAWFWRAEHLNEYFPDKQSSIENCIAMFSNQWKTQ